MAVGYSCTVRRIRCALAAQRPRRAASSLAPRRPHLGALSVPARLASRSARIITVLTGRRIRRAAAVFQGLLVLVEVVEEARELVRGPAHGVDRLHVVHARRAEQADRAEIAVLQAVGRTDERDSPEARLLDLGADPHERAFRAEARAHELEERGPLLELLEEALVTGQVAHRELVEEAGSAADVEVLLSRLQHLGEGRLERGEEGPLARWQLRGLEPAPPAMRTGAGSRK